MHQQIIDYLKQNKDKYSKEVLIEQLKKVGYGELEINKAVDFVYSNGDLNDINRNDKSRFRGQNSSTQRISKKMIVVIGSIIVLIICVFIVGLVIKKKGTEGIDNSNNRAEDYYSENDDVSLKKDTGNNFNITNYETEGNLKKTHQVGCTELNQITNQYTPADIIPAYADCVRKNKYDMAQPLYLVAKVYAVFDTMRVADTTAHQAYTVLLMNNTTDFDKIMVDNSASAWEKMLDSKEAMHKVCSQIKKISYPSYYPEYMIAHGMEAIINSSVEVLVENFDSEALWGKIMNEFAGGVCQDNYQGGIIKLLANKGSVNNGQFLTYVNNEYGFQITFPESWQGYLVTENKYGKGSEISFGFPEQKGLFVVGVYTKDDWEAMKEDINSGNVPGHLPEVLGKNNKYIYASVFTYEVANGLEKQAEDITKIENSFKLLK